MSSHSNHARPNLCRNQLTRSPWAWPLLLLIASPLSRGLAVGGTLMLGTGCTDVYDCDQWRTECRETCAPDDVECLIACEDEYDLCVEEVYLAAERRAERADAIADASVACFAVAMCTLESIGDEDEGSTYDPEPEPQPEPDPNDDWGEDWGEQNPAEELEVFTPTEFPDLPEG
jgi:hypothetical protein